MNLSIPPHVVELIRHIESAGHQVWCVGGCVRDALLGRFPADWDLATTALPGQVKELFSEKNTVDKGLAHGTVGIPVLGSVVEITTLRVESQYMDRRRPQLVAFTQSLEQDLARRDFTVNALAYHPDWGLTDCFGGLADLRQGLLRCVGQPEKRFQEDALRILRCLRFAATLGFAVHPQTLQAAKDCRELLGALSTERIREELTRLLCGGGAGPVLEWGKEIFFAALPELAPLDGCAQETPYHCYDCWGHTLHTVEAVPAEPLLRWAALLHDCGKPAVKSYDSHGQAHFYGHAQAGARLAEQVLHRLHFSIREAERITALVKRHGQALPIREKRIKKLLGAWGEEGVRQLLALVEADLLAQAPQTARQRLPLVEEARTLVRDILDRGECLGLSSLAVGGRDLLALGYQPGPALGAALHQLLEEVLAGTLENRREILLKKAQEWL